MRLHLRVDVCTFRGLREGVPPLLDLFRRRGVRATFYVAMGPDRSGRAIFNLFRPGFASKMVRTGAPAMYGWSTMLYGTLLPSPMIGSGHRGLLDRIRAEGHELGAHGWNHRRWQDRLDAMSPAEIEVEIARQAEAIGPSLSTMAAPAWLTHDAALAAQDRLGLRFASDVRGDRPAIPEGRRVPQIPVTLPTLDEVIGRSGFPQAIIEEARNRPFLCYAAHAESEGRRYIEPFEQLLDAFNETAPLGLAPLDHLPSARIERRPLPGRSGSISFLCE